MGSSSFPKSSTKSEPQSSHEDIEMTNPDTAEQSDSKSSGMGRGNPADAGWTVINAAENIISELCSGEAALNEALQLSAEEHLLRKF